MTALAPASPPEPPVEVDLGTELDGLRRRADDQAQLLRKHQAAVTQLADSVAALVALGKKRSRWINLNSFVAYVLFTMLLGGAMFVLYRSRVGALEAASAEVVAEREARATTAPQAPVHDEAAAAALYALVRAGDDAGLVARERELAAAALTATERAMLTDAAVAARARLAHRPADDGIAAFRAGAWGAAAPALERALDADAAGPGAAQLRYYLGVAKWKLGDHRAAADQLERALAGTLDASANDARYFLAASLDRLGDVDRARAEYDRFATAQPKAPLAVHARRRSAILVRKARLATGQVTTAAPVPSSPPVKPVPAAAGRVAPRPRAAAIDEPVVPPPAAPAVEPPATATEPPGVGSASSSPPP